MSAPTNTPASLGSAIRIPATGSAFPQDEISHTLLIGYGVGDRQVSASSILGLRPGDAVEAQLIRDELFVISRDPSTAPVSSFYAPLDDNVNTVTTILPAHKQVPRTELSNYSGSIVDVSVEDVAQIRLKAGKAISIQCFPAGCQVSESFAEQNECLDPAPEDRGRLPSLWVSLADEHHEYQRIPETTHIFRIVPEPTTAQTSISDQASHVESEVGLLAEQLGAWSEPAPSWTLSLGALKGKPILCAVYWRSIGPSSVFTSSWSDESFTMSVTSRPDYLLVPTDMATMAASLNDLTDSLPIRRGETWLCQLSHEPESIQCRLVDTDRQQTWIFTDRGRRTCVLIEAEDYSPNFSERPKVDIWGFTQITLPRDAAFALTCVDAGGRPPASPWRCLFPANSLSPADSVDAQRQKSIWINIDTEDDLVVLRSEADAFISIRVRHHPEGWANT